jgi:hypothetical protein
LSCNLFSQDKGTAFFWQTQRISNGFGRFAKKIVGASAKIGKLAGHHAATKRRT